MTFHVDDLPCFSSVPFSLARNRQIVIEESTDSRFKADEQVGAVYLRPKEASITTVSVEVLSIWWSFVAGCMNCHSSYTACSW